MADSAPKLFGTDGIRGRYGNEPLTEPSIRRIGAAIGQALSSQKASSRAKPPLRVLLGRDTRGSGPEILNALNAGLASEKYECVDLGVLPTPGVAYSVRNLGAAAGIVISASHNPAADNGIKVFGSDGFKLADEIEDAINRAYSTQSDIDAGNRQGTSSHQHVQAYKDHLLAFAHELGSDKPLNGKTLVVDCAHGAASALAPDIFRELGANVIEHGTSPNGDNINLDCGALYPENLSDIILKEKADGGVCFDGDSDRVILLDETGRVLDGDHILAILARELKASGQLAGDHVVGTVMANLGLELCMKDLGVSLVREAVGDRYVVARMLCDDYVLGGEQSGHIIHFTRGSTTGDGIFTAINVLARIWSKDETLSANANILEKFPQVLTNVRVREKPPLNDLPGMPEALLALENDLGERGRVVLRYSGTEDLARVMVEGAELGKTQQHAQAIASVVEKEIGADER